MTDFQAELDRYRALLETTLKARAVNASFIGRRRVLLHDLPDFAAQTRGSSEPETE